MSDEEPLIFKKHPRNTVLGASLLLESMFPDLPVEKINELAPFLADEFNQFKEDICKK